MQKFLYGTGVFFAVLIVIGLALPRHARIAVSTRIDAPPATVFAQVNDYHRFALWSPWINTDPNARVVYSGPTRGVGATMTWDGTIIGTGTQSITVSRPFEYVETVVSPGEPAEARFWFDIKGDRNLTTITWSFETDFGYNLVGRYLALAVAGVIRRDYEHGLDSLKDLAETLPKADFGDIQIEQLVVEPVTIAYLPTMSIPQSAAISLAMGDAYFEILNFIDRHELVEAGAPISIMQSFIGSELRFDAAIPVRGVSDSTPRGSGKVRLGQTYSGSVIRVRHIGAYRDLGDTHRKIAAYMAALGLERAGNAWESYVSDPTKVAESELLTYVFYPIKP